MYTKFVTSLVMTMDHKQIFYKKVFSMLILCWVRLSNTKCTNRQFLTNELNIVFIEYI